MTGLDHYYTAEVSDLLRPMNRAYKVLDRRTFEGAIEVLLFVPV